VLEQRSALSAPLFSICEFMKFGKNPGEVMTTVCQRYERKTKFCRCDHYLEILVYRSHNIL
jgi:hypothetical protein